MKKGYLLIIGIFCLTLVTANAQYTDLHDFNLSDGADPYGSLAISGNVLFGVTMAGGANWASDDGNIFSVKTDGSQFADLFDFDAYNGRNPNCVLAISGNLMYGLTWMGGGGNYGNIFNIKTSGASFNDMHDFNNISGANPRGSLTVSGNVMYGTTESGGTYGYGSIFSINMDGSGFKDLFDFNNTNGATPKGSLILSNGILYGMTEVGGIYSSGNIFSIKADGTGFTDLFDFNGANGSSPQGSLILAGNKLYGMTFSGGTHGGGEVFSINTNGTSFKNMYDFYGLNGDNPAGDLTLNGHTMYGMTSGGGVFNYGMVFSIDTNGTAYTDVYDFDYTNGAYPFGSLTLSGNMLYGMTEGGGAGGCGVVFSLKLTTLTVSIASTSNVTCSGDDNGKSIANAATGGTLPYTYSWAPGGGNNLTASNLSAGTYTITATDNNGFTATASTTITQPQALDISIESVTKVVCERTASITSHPATGGVAPYSYKWSQDGETNLTISALSEGTYSITVTDNNGCTAVASETIVFPAKLTVSTNTVASIGCNGEKTGALTALPSGGTPSYSYLWFPGEGTRSTESDLKAGTYMVTVTDSNGCSVTASATITEPSPIVLKTETGNIKGEKNGSCNGNASVAVISGGVGPYKYLWSQGNQTTDTIKNQCAGTYCCTVTDANGCSQTACVSITAVTGIENLTSSGVEINVYPNPTSSLVNVSGVEKGMIIEMYDNLGRSISNLIADNDKMQLNLMGQAQGMYLVRVLAKDGSIVDQKKVIKTN
ncbi:MAG TPA: choice-of-anchor tandem repeat GloVer-containing protein [Bacteroidia bacterium]|jgi:uncharacterized repeat protein (TIGR03803 family)|nr:choice-of-anchor tandem repeat GloVer-containing protein [Bacteroidia bacterium]